MLVSAAKTALKAYGFDDNDPLNTWLEAAKSNFEAADNWPFLRKITTIAMTAGDTDVSGAELPADFFKVMTVRDNTDKRKLTYIDPVTFDRDIETTTETGVPQFYTVFANAVAPFYALTIWPAALTAWTLQLRYEAVLADITGLADGVSMPGPTIIHYPIVQGAAAIALQVDNEEDRAATAQQLSSEAISRLKRKFFSDLDESRQVVDVMGYGSQ